jgi:hypothetical protein
MIKKTLRKWLVLGLVLLAVLGQSSTSAKAQATASFNLLSRASSVEKGSNFVVMLLMQCKPI